MANFDFKSYRADVDRKAAAARRGMEGLVDGNGQPVYMPDMHEEQKARLLIPLGQAVDETIELAGRAQVEAKKLEASQHSDPLTELSTEDLQRLDVAREMAKADIEALTRPELAARLLSVADSDNKVSQFLHLLYAKPIVDESDDMELRSRFDELDNVVNGAQRGKAEKALAEAERLRKEAAELSFYASDTYAEVSGAKADALEQRRLAYGVF